MKNILNLLFNPKGKISSPVYILGMAVSIILFIILSGFCLAVRFITSFQGTLLNIAFGIIFFTFIYQINVMTIKRLKDIGFISFLASAAKRLIAVIITLAGLGVIAGIFAIFALIWQAFHIPEKIFEDGSNVRVIECTSPFGSWFNMNELTIKPNGFFYEKKGVLSKKCLSIPYSTVKRVSFIDGQFWNRVIITPAHFSLFKNEMYILSDSNFQNIKTVIQNTAGASIIIEEKKSLANHVLHPFSK